MQSTKSNKLGEKSKFDKKIYSSSDIYSIASIDLNKEEEPANSKLKRAAKFPIKEEEDES